MKTARTLAILAIATAMTGVPAADVVVEAAESSPLPAPTAPAAPSPTSAPTTQTISPIDAIRTAPDPSAAVDAYTRARANGQGTLDLEKAYVHRMVELNVPEMCDLQARDVAAQDPSDGIAQAVCAYMAAERGHSGQAAQQLQTAMRLAPGDPFAQRTAAQVVAWYDAHDTQADRSQLTTLDVQAIESLRSAGGHDPGFVEAYKTALDLQRARAAAAAAPIAGNSPTTNSPTTNSPTTNSPTTNSPTTNSPTTESSLYPPYTYVSPSYASPYSSAPYYQQQPASSYVYNNYYYPDPYAYGPYYPYPYWWPGGIIFSDVIITHHDHFHHFDFDHDGHFFPHRDGFIGRDGFDRGGVPLGPSAPMVRPAPMRPAGPPPPQMSPTGRGSFGGGMRGGMGGERGERDGGGGGRR